VARSIAWPIAPFDCAAVSTCTPFPLDGLKPRVAQFSVDDDWNRIPSKPAMPMQ
jgi:hypothetical protein